MFKKLTAIILLFALFSVDVISAETPTAKPTVVSYRATFNSTWSPETHPSDNFPPEGLAHWSRLVGATHNETVTFWEVDELASVGIKDVAERGSNTQINNEVDAAITAGSADAYLFGNALGSDTGTITLEFDVVSTHDHVTLVTMIAPSPDWFTGVTGQPLRDVNGQWLDEVVVDLYPYDAGTDSGTDYRSANSITNPAQPIVNAQGLSPFSNATLGTLTFTRLTNPTAITLTSVNAGNANHAHLLVVGLLALLTLQLVLNRNAWSSMQAQQPVRPLSSL